MALAHTVNHNSLQSPKIVRTPILFITKSSPIEKLLFSAILFFFLIGLILIVERVSNAFSVRIPIQGGILNEGIVGFPSNVNPVTARSNADYDLVALSYSGLVRVDENGEMIPDLAESFSISDDGETYTFTLRNDIYFHDNTPITANDIVFTIESIQNPAMESPLSSVFSTVTATAVDPMTVSIELQNPYAGFLSEMTIGIIPQHIWEGVTPDSLRFIELSSYPVGSGPFKVEKVERSESLGVPTHYSLVAHTEYAPKRPYLNSIKLSFYADESELIDALERNRINSAPAVSPSLLAELNLKPRELATTSMLRIFGLFFNPSETSILSNESVRRAIDMAIDREMLAESIYSGYAKPTRTPLPFDKPADVTEDSLGARELLETEGWEENSETGIREKDSETLSFTIKTGETSDLKNTAIFLQQTLRSIGIEVTIETYDITTLNQTVIRQRDYEALLFGQAYGRFIDLYPFWHSSNRDDPGLNIARHTSSDTDEALVALRRETDENIREGYFEEILDEFSETTPAAFLYTPDFVYIKDERINNIKIPPVERSSDRFSNIEEWFIHSDSVWKIFLDTQQ
ncbi:MAG: peptide ABC transporter substrate-binding protein [Candidatus Paceibacterota bacterium]